MSDLPPYGSAPPPPGFRPGPPPPPPPAGGWPQAPALDPGQGRLGYGTLRAYFDANTPGVLSMSAMGSLFTFLTLGLYRFWFIVRLRKELWRRASLAGSTFEYTGTVWEIFKGFLIALIFLLPIAALYFAGQFLAATARYQGIGATLTAVGVSAFLFFLYFASYRARRYRMSRTLWRGVRFRQSGSGLAFAFMNFGWILAALFSFGWSIVFGRAQLERYRVNNSWFGDRRFHSEASGLAMLFPFILFILALLAPLIIAGVVFFINATPDFLKRLSVQGALLAQAAERNTMPPFEKLPDLVLLLFLIVPGIIWLYFGPLLLWPFYRAHEIRSYTRRIYLAGTRFKSDFSAWDIYSTYILFMIVAGFALSILGGFSAVIIQASGGFSEMNPVVAIATGGVYVVMLWVLSVLRLKMLLFDLTGKRIRATTVIGIEYLADVVSRPDKAGALGDDFAGGFDLGAI